MNDFSAFAPHIPLFEEHKDQIIDLWVMNTDLNIVLDRHEIEVEFFAENFASAVLDYFINVAKGVSAIGDCPVMAKFLQYLRNKDINSSELFVICTKFRKAMIDITYKYGINTEAVYTDIAFIFDKNFAGVLESFSKTIKEAEDNLKTTDKLLTQYKVVVDHATLVSKTNVHGVINYANESFCKATGYNESELLGQTHTILRDMEMTDLYFRDMWHQIQSGQVFQDTIKNRTKDGAVLYLETVIVPLFDDKNSINGYMSIRHDVTERLDAVENALLAEELATLAKEDALAAEKSKDDFLSNMSHEIRTPMNAILGFVQLLQRSDIGSKEKGYLDVISNAGSSLLTIINDILDFAKIRSGKFSLDPFLFDPFYEFESAIELFTSKMNEKKLDFLVYIDPKLPKEMKADAIRIKQIMLNFLSNALKFTPEHGSIRVQILFDQDSSKLSLYVKDSGIGVSEENRAKIFQAFSQEKVDTTRKFGGTGLGLSICESLVNMMEGEIGIDSVEGEGSTFYIHVPVKVMQESLETTFESSIALIRDQNSIAHFKLLGKYLLQMGIEVKTYSSFPDRIDEGITIIGLADRSNAVNYNQTETKFIMMDTISRDDVEIDESISTLYLPIYPSKIMKLFDYDIDKQKHVDRTTQFQGHLLVAEDNKTNQMLISILLQEHGVTFDIAEDGEQAYECYVNNSYDLVLMDNNMPKMSGIEATEKILKFEQDEKRPFTPIVALTANASNEDKERFLVSGMDDFLAKPLDVAELERVLNTYLKDGASIDKAKEEVVEVSDSHEEMIIDNYDTVKIDKEALSEKIGLPVKMIDRLVDSFLEDTPSVLEKLEDAVRNKDIANIELYSHSIKGSAANMNLEIMQDTAKEMEFAAKDKKSDYNYEASFTQLKSMFESLKEGE
jgi:PAS domain S-box-containing protein